MGGHDGLVVRLAGAADRSARRERPEELHLDRRLGLAEPGDRDAVGETGAGAHDVVGDLRRHDRLARGERRLRGLGALAREARALRRRRNRLTEDVVTGALDRDPLRLVGTVALRRHRPRPERLPAAADRRARLERAEQLELDREVELACSAHDDRVEDLRPRARHGRAHLSRDLRARLHERRLRVLAARVLRADHEVGARDLRLVGVVAGDGRRERVRLVGGVRVGGDRAGPDRRPRAGDVRAARERPEELHGRGHGRAREAADLDAGRRSASRARRCRSSRSSRASAAPGRRSARRCRRTACGRRCWPSRRAPRAGRRTTRCGSPRPSGSCRCPARGP